MGGNGLSEVCVWVKGNICCGCYLWIGEIIEEFVDWVIKFFGIYEEFGDVLKEEIVCVELNIDFFFNYYVY